MKVLAIGDIHTKLWIIDKVREIANQYDKVVFVGDYADDWDSSPAQSILTWKELRSLSHSNPCVKLVAGNHDFIYTNKTSSLSSGYNMTTQMLLDTPENKGLKEWLHNLPIAETVDGVRYSHAGFTKHWSETWGLDRGYGYTGYALWTDSSPLWVRPKNGLEYIPFQVFGHTPSQSCWEVQPNVWCIDTFSTYPNGDSVGDCSVLEITDGKTFNKIKFGNKNGNNSTNGIPT